MKKLIAWTLSLALLAGLGGCGTTSSAPSAPSSASGSYIPGALGDAKSEQEPEAKPEQQPEQKDEQKPAQKPEAKPSRQEQQKPGKGSLSGDAASVTQAQSFSNDAGISIDVLREEITNAGSVFGVSYIGYFEKIEETGIDFPQWYAGESSALVSNYPFAAEIDEAHTIREEGHLYCILAGEYEASIEVSAMDGEVLYRAKNGEPILVFCNQDGDPSVIDTVITVTTADGTVFRYEPALDELGFPQLLIGAERQNLSWDFTPIADEGFDFGAWMEMGWGGVTGLGLSGESDGNSWWFTSWDNSVSYCLTFYPNGGDSNDGEAVLECYDPADFTLRACWEGWWRIETELDQPSWLSLDLMLMHGSDQESFASAAVISESYHVMVPMSGESLLLVTDTPGMALLPVFPEGAQTVELELSYG